MKKFFLLILLLLLHPSVRGQNNDIWTAFWAADSIHIGYKNEAGIIQIEPKFMGVTLAQKFEHIIAVSEEVNGAWQSYYLTKEGTIAGRDSLYIFDNGADCESEGFIRFTDPTTRQIGLFNRKGEVAISAEYNALSRVRNGMVVGLRGAEKRYWDKTNHAGCNHFSWSGGEEVLLDTLNNVLVENFEHKKALNFFSLEKSESPSTDSRRKSFLAVDGKTYYSFVEYEEEFKQWLFNDLFVDLTEEKLLAVSYKTLFWESATGWANSPSDSFIKTNFAILKKGLLEIQESKCDYFITQDGLNPFMYEGAEFEMYFNNCREAKEGQYPTMTIVISHQDKKSFTQNHFEFLRMDEGYRLIAVTVRNKKIK
ncbi:hypothetical protein [Myroides sp. WP-1]|uniref:hypothetical protein n=1 Tax=Myroides sp. WP-1 TaxID=2759944 RepID=UPI0015FB9C81|nr:hypothetical protein [Myroides sp. WP-1]MBB1139008.1 hypothetical protein [Myroides sp. WP-1]